MNDPRRTAQGKTRGKQNWSGRNLIKRMLSAGKMRLKRKRKTEMYSNGAIR